MIENVIMNFRFRKPDRYEDPTPAKIQNKWDCIINAFMDSRFDELKQIHRTGTRGRIFAFLVKNMLDILPDYILTDGSWLEITLSENTAYQKLFRYGHQAPMLKVIWFDEDTGLHKKICQGIEFPNAQVIDIQEYFKKLEITPEGIELINIFYELKRLKGIIR